MTKRSRVVIVGGGMAGARLARALGSAPDGPAVTVVAEERRPAYNRVLLAEVVAGRYPAETITLPAPAPAVDWRAGTRARELDPERRRVRCTDGAELPYDALVLATGAAPEPAPPAEDGTGGATRGVHTLRTLDDALAVAEAAGPGVRAVVVGGGPLGVTAAGALAARGCAVLLAERADRLLPGRLDASAAALLRDRLAGAGVEVRTGHPVRALRTRPDGRGRAVAGVVGGDGADHPAELVVAAGGVRPRTALARAAGLALGAGGGVAVDDRLRTSAPDVYALGDCAAHAGRLYGLAVPAQEQADVLADVLTGGRAHYRGTRSLTRLTLTSAAGDAFDLAAFGLPEAAPGDDEVRLADATRGAYRKVVVRGDRLRGGVLVGDLGGVGTLARAWEGDEPLPDTPLLHLLTDDICSSATAN
ncbi:assimilatory nitrate reductase electron transfer subunit [Streptomyces zhaozhouensis]|uniref:Assimilatory nitrate reductase electron transfer subunit n=1 Tax=Streptomyces zhaozhouensis TaxID=1300267 RepID=A0A286DPZ2_9ACTN|nr:FAD-dependent oxidoreductase [Streptomyces zhaozhouensis]SOD60604.1 assimilatory nitrate reductase electron transfer subunit [Streptomyces zhaozhouensis]